MSGQPDEQQQAAIEPSSTASPAATVYTLEPGLGDPEWDARWQALVDAFLTDTPEKVAGPLRRVLEVARLNGCRTVLVEERYLDPDYRSEFAAFWSKRFETREPQARRLHFFTKQISAEELHALPEDHGYLGYSVLRPTPLGPVGRTVVKPPPELDGAVLTQVHDKPTVFGQQLDVTGVPFCQQDGELLICAHTAAWMCHYVAYGRGIIGRRTTADIVRMPSPQGSRHRPVPSTGLTSEQLQGIFTALDIPAFFYDIGDLPELPAELPRGEGEGEAADQQYEQDVLREQILRVACKYLNSGFPVVVLTENGAGHAFTLVGWQKTEGGVRLIGCDDQFGPYEVISDPLEEPDDRERTWKSFMVPLPEKVFLTGEAAEIGARNTVLVTADEYSQLNDPDVDDPQANDLSQIARHLDELRGKISVRTRLVEGRYYKAMLDQQKRSDGPLRLLRLAHLPHWVWLVEFHDRAARDDEDDPQPCVLAEVVLDSTAHDDLPVNDLLSTTSLSADLGRARENEPDEATTAKGDGKPWRSMISDRTIVEHILSAESGEQAPGGRIGEAA